MATLSPSSSLLNLRQQFIASFLLVTTITLIPHVNGCFTSVFSFGDSMADTGNSVRIRSISESGNNDYSAFPPYGRTFFHHPTGRASDGRLVIDFIAEEFGLPYLPPYFGVENDEERSKKFEKGVNFAVGGATAVDDGVLRQRGITNTATNVSLGVQLGLFKHVLSSLCSSPSDCKNLLGSSLIAMGEIGGNDYNFPIWGGKSIEEARDLVPLVIHTIASAIKELIELGAVTFLVPGNFPVGCSPSYLTLFQGSNEADYDPLTGCITWLNQFSEYHNQLLQTELDRIRELHPHVTIVYADYYNAAMSLYRSPKQYGFTNTLVTCCGGGGPYNCSFSMNCGSPAVRTSCDDPSSHISWDGVHYTEATNRWIAKAVLQQLFTIPYINTLCLPSMTMNNNIIAIE